MQKNILSAIIVLSMLCSMVSFSSAQAANEPLVCAEGNRSTADVLLTEVPTYDYGPDGLVRFHLKKLNPWPQNGTMGYNYFDNGCNIVSSGSWGNMYMQGVPEGLNLEIRAQQEPDGSFSFGYYYEGGAYTGYEVYVPHTTAPIVQISLNFYSGQPGYSTWTNYYFSTPAVPVKISTQSYKTPILIVPGVMGTEIKNGEELLWANAVRMANPLNNDSFMDDLQFDQDLIPIVESLTTAGVITRKPFFDYTEGLSYELVSQGYTEGQDLFTFPYDWRFGVSSSTVTSQLEGQIGYILTQTDAGKSVGKVNVIAHSTGGLVVKKYVTEHPQDHHIDKAVFVGVPNTGAPKAVKALLIGEDFDITGLSEKEMKKLAQNMPVVYDLAPSQRYYDTKGSFIEQLHEERGMPQHTKWLTYQEYEELLLNKYGMNRKAFENAKNLHTESFDNYDLRTSGVDLYNIVGCKASTIGVVDEYYRSGGRVHLGSYKGVLGDGTVPLESATNLPVDSSKRYFALRGSHAKMMSQDGTRQLITNILTGSSLPVSSVSQNINDCQLNGKAGAMFSPVDILITDNQGNQTGNLEGDVTINEIPNASFDAIDGHKFFYVPTDEGQTYDIKLKGTGGGTFTFKLTDVVNSQYGRSESFVDVPVTASLQGSVELGSTTTLVLDSDGNGTVDQSVLPTSILDANQSQDLFSPVSTSTLSGIMGREGFYRSDVEVSLDATDPVIEGHEAETAGVLETRYSLDGGEYQIYGSSTPVTVSAEGSHTITYYSTDRAGNREEEQVVSFTIDQTPPEAVIQFSPQLKDLTFTGTDNQSASSGISVLDKDDVVTIADEAGNALEIKLKEKGRKRLFRAEIKSISYNDKPAATIKNGFTFFWGYDKKNTLKLLTQNVSQKKGYNISAIYGGKDTLLAGKDSTGRILKTLKGLVLLKVATNQGDLRWSY